MRPQARAAVLAAALALPGCTPKGGDAVAGGPTPAPPGVEQPALPGPAADRPPFRRDTIQIEGTPTPVELRLVRSPADFSTPFTTYAPTDFIIEVAGQGENRAVRFIAAFGGRRNDRAFMDVVMYPPGLSEADALARAQRTGFEASDGADFSPAEGPPWAIRAWRIQGRGREGMVLGGVHVGRHGARYFHVLTRYPAEYADGFGPRARVILDEWRWGDGSALGGEAGPARPARSARLTAMPPSTEYSSESSKETAGGEACDSPRYRS